MSPQQLNEQRFVTDFIKRVFNAVVDQRNRALERAMEKDPEFQKIVGDVEKSRRDLEAWVARRAKSDPNLADKLKLVRSFK